MPDETEQGRWDPVFGLPDVAIHVTVLPTGKVLAWGRRKDPHGSMHQQGCAPFVWDPATGTTTSTEEPHRADGTTPVNLFCSGHTHLADGRLLVAGGHITDGDGLDQACVYDATDGSWTALPPLLSGRWYPSAITLADGRALVISGSHQDGPNQPVEPVPEICGTDVLGNPTRDFIGLPLYPRIHLTPDNRIAMSGSNPLTNAGPSTTGPGEWAPPPGADIARAKSERQYGPAGDVLTRPDRLSGRRQRPGRLRPPHGRLREDRPHDTVPGLGTGGDAWPSGVATTTPRCCPTGRCWSPEARAAPASTTLAGPVRPCTAAELWDPATDVWTTLAAEDVDRCYHSTAILLPDATVLSAGGGEIGHLCQSDRTTRPDTHRRAMRDIFHPRRPLPSGRVLGPVPRPLPTTSLPGRRSPSPRPERRPTP